VPQRNGEITIRGNVVGAGLGSRLPDRRVSIVADDGSCYEVVPSFLGAYLQGFVGWRVEVRARVMLRGPARCIVQIASLRLVHRPASADCSPEAGIAAQTVDRAAAVMPSELGGLDQ
jgi:hypothetical protein